MAQYMISMSLLVALATVQPFTKFLASLKVNREDSIYGPGTVVYYCQNPESVFVITMAPIVLLLGNVDFQKGERRSIVHVLE
jgi:hypothetical protein